ncbi:MAG TPA: isochorismatase family protein [Trebonia sp.]|jgi:nicotinamidase-related amidase
MTSAPVRDPLADHFITPENAAFLFIDYQPSQLATTVNSWEDIEFVQAVHATGRRKLIICALWTEVCMAFTALDALREGYEVYPVVDAIAGTSPEAHRAGLDRVTQAGGQPISWVSLACELQRDWARQETVQAIVEIVLTDRLTKE